MLSYTTPTVIHFTLLSILKMSKRLLAFQSIPLSMWAYISDPKTEVGMEFEDPTHLEPLLDIVDMRMDMTSNFLKMKVTER